MDCSISRIDRIVDSGLSASAQAKINVLKSPVPRMILILPAKIMQDTRRCMEHLA